LSSLAAEGKRWRRQRKAPDFRLLSGRRRRKRSHSLECRRRPRRSRRRGHPGRTEEKSRSHWGFERRQRKNQEGFFSFFFLTKNKMNVERLAHNRNLFPLDLLRLFLFFPHYSDEHSNQTMATLQRSALRSTTSVRGGARVGAVSAPVRRVAGRRGVAARAEKVRGTCVDAARRLRCCRFFYLASTACFLGASRALFSRRPLFEGCSFDVSYPVSESDG